MTPRRLLVAAVVAVSVVLVLAAGLTRPGDGCPDSAFRAALSGLTDQQPDACESAATDRLFAVSAALLGLVMVSGLLSRRAPG